MSSEIRSVPSGRVLSIDALRGFDMFWITGGAFFFRTLLRFFNTPFFHSLSAQLRHSKWDGFTFYDLIFPLFLFIVGASMPFAISKRLQRGDNRKKLYIHIVKRSLILLFLGFIFNGFLDLNLSNFRWAGVLQRISLCYFFSALIVMNTNIRNQAIIAGIMLLFYWAVMTLIPVPGFGAGILTPEGNLSAYIDQHFLPGEFCCYKFGDNEGILSTIPAIASTLIGVLAGHWLRTSFTQEKKVLVLLAAGAVSLILGFIWDFIFPINKSIWTSSYVLFGAGWSLILLGLFYWVIDVRGYKKWSFPFVIIGLNPITIFVVQQIFDFGIIANIFVHGFIDIFGSFRPLFWAFCVLMVKWLFLYFLYKKKIFLKA